MSLDILKERFSGKLITSQYEDKIESKQKIIDKLEEETNNLSNQVVNLESEKNTLLQELNKARHFEDGAFSIKEKNYINKLQSKDLMIKEVEQKTNSLYKELDKKDERLIYKLIQFKK
jgi:GTP-dependent phosphoenolpyruvate carboxykinase